MSDRSLQLHHLHRDLKFHEHDVFKCPHCKKKILMKFKDLDGDLVLIRLSKKSKEASDGKQS